MRMRIGSVAFAILITAGLAAADGCFVPPKEQFKRLYGDLGAASTEQKAVIIEAHEGREVLLLQTTYQGRASEFAWVVPVPGEPREDGVFTASSDFIESLLEGTAPKVTTYIQEAEASGKGMMEGAMLAPPSDEAPGGEPSVTVHHRMEVGDYDVSVLSATGPNVLVDWLNEHGYATPDDHADIFGHYVEKRWFFVAMRVLPRVVEEKPVLDDVKPIGIDFPTPELVYPLYISRASSREKTGMTLISLTREPAMCEELERAALPLKLHPPGTSYAEIRRAVIEQANRPAAVVEYAGYREGNRDLHWRDDRGPAEDVVAVRDLWATRLWTIIDREQMEDLTFGTADLRADRVKIIRRGEIPPPDIAETGIPAWPVAGLLFLVLGAARIEGRRVPAPILSVALVSGGAVIYANVLPGALRGVAVAFCLCMVVVVLALYLAGKADRGRERIGAGRLITWTLLAAGWVAVADHLSSSRLTSLSLLDWWQIALTGAWIILLVVEITRACRRIGRKEHGRVALSGAVALLVFILAVPNSIGSFHTRVLGPTWEAVLAGIVAAGVVAGAAYVVLRVTRRKSDIALREHAAIAGATVVAGMITIWAYGGILIDVQAHWYYIAVTTRLPLVIASAVLLGYVTAALSFDGEPGQAARIFALTLLVVGAALSVGRVAFSGPAHAGATVIRYSGVGDLDRALTRIDHALDAFREDTGCYPAALEDLASDQAPEYALDSSGNEAELPDGLSGSWITELPIDPLTGERNTWVYEVTGAPMVDSGGLTIDLRREPTRERPR
jgi:hypothetical protein